MFPSNTPSDTPSNNQPEHVSELSDNLILQSNELGSSGRLLAPEAQEIELIKRSINNFSHLSRCCQGISDTSVSEHKRALVLTGKELADATTTNIRAALIFLVPRIKLSLGSPAEVEDLFHETAKITNSGLLPDNVPYYRVWPGYTGQVSPDKIVEALQGFYCEYLARHMEFVEVMAEGQLQDVQNKAIEMAAWIEKRYNHEIHPQYDGCGKNSKVHAVAFLTLAGLTYPIFSDRDTYIGYRSRSLEAWTDIYRDLCSSYIW